MFSLVDAKDRSMINSQMSTMENASPDFERQFLQAINARRKLKGNKPKFVITDSQVQSDNDQVILTVKSLQTFLLSCVDKSPRAYSASWCKVLRVQKIQQIFVIVLNGLTDAEYQQLKETEGLQAWRDVFTSGDLCREFRFHTQTEVSLVEQFSKIAAKGKSVDTTRLDRSLLKNKAEQLSQQQSPAKKWKKSSVDQFSRVNLVLNLKQLLTGNYPCPTHNPFAHFRSLKSSYQSLSSSSPILALDVETFEDTLTNRQVPYWISVVDEQFNCVYQTLIQPKENHNEENYQQRRTQVMNTVPEIQERTFEEVHEDLDQLFTGETILAGHSVENDLKYLQLYYPYIIDTSIIFNITGTRLEKSSLQKLYAVFFGHLIQKTRLEHDPTEDARATMELIQLKLSQNVAFGDWFLGGVDQLKVLGNYDSLQLNEDLEQCQTFVAQTKFGLHEDFFKKIKQQNKAVMIDRPSTADLVSLPTLGVESNRQALKACVEQISTHELVWLQLHFSSSIDRERELRKLKKYLRKFYQLLREDSILLGMIVSEEEKFGRCFVRIKDEENFLPLLINGDEHPYNLKLTKTS